MEPSGLTSLQETTIPNLTHSPPDPEPFSSLPPGYFTDQASGQTSPFIPLGIWTTENPTLFSNGEVDDMQWAAVFGGLPSSTNNY